MRKRLFALFFASALGVILLLAASCADDSSDGDEQSKVVTVTVTFNMNSENAGEAVTVTGSMSDESFEKGEPQALTANAFIASDPKYAFVGWAQSSTGEVIFTDGQVVAFDSDTTLFAVWKRGYIVTFNANHGTLPQGYTVAGTMASEFFAGLSGSEGSVEKELTDCAYTCAGFKFLGWGEASGGPVLHTNKKKIAISKDTTLYAIWERTHYRVAFDANCDGDVGSQMEVALAPKTGTFKLPACSYKRRGYNFSGWAKTKNAWSATYTDEQSVTSPFTADTTLYALWSAKVCKATFDKNGADSGSVADIANNKYEDKDYSGVGKFTFPQNAFVYAGHTFCGWATVEKPEEGARVYFAGEKVVWLWDGDQKFFAIWEEASADPLKMNDSVINTASISFAATNTFTGTLTKADFSAILAATKSASTAVTLDFSQCTGYSFGMEDASYSSEAPNLAGVVPKTYSDKNEKLTSIVLPKFLARVPNYAFYHCIALVSVTVGEGTTEIGESAFGYCEKLATVTLGENIETLGRSAFSNTAITAVSIGKKVESIVAGGIGGTFHGTKLAIINVDTDNEKYCAQGNVLFDKDKTKLLLYPPKKNSTSYTVPDSVTQLCDYAMYDANDSLTSIRLGAGVKAVGSYGIVGSAISLITLNSGLEALGDYALSGNSALEAIQLPQSLKTIGGKAFNDCAKLKSINIPASVQTIGEDAFETGGYPSSALEAINVDSENTKYSSKDAVLFNKEGTLLIKYPPAKAGATYTIGSSVTKLEKKAFANAKNLSSVFIPSTVTTIETSESAGYGYLYAPFYGCNSTLILNCQAASAPSGFGEQWNYYDRNGALTTKYSQTAPSE